MQQYTVAMLSSHFILKARTAFQTNARQGFGSVEGGGRGGGAVGPHWAASSCACSSPPAAAYYLCRSQARRNGNGSSAIGLF